MYRARNIYKVIAMRINKNKVIKLKNRNNSLNKIEFLSRKLYNNRDKRRHYYGKWNL